MQAGQSMRTADQPAASIGPRPRRGSKRALLCAAGVIAALTALAEARADSPETKIEGVWRVTRHGVNCQTGQLLSSFPAIMAFAGDGSLSGYAVPPGSSPAMGSPDYGTWKRERGTEQYSFRLLSYNYDVGGAFGGTTEVTGRLTLADGAGAFSYTATVQFFDAFGGALFSVCGAATGTRF